MANHSRGSKYRCIIRVYFDPHQEAGYLALCNDGTIWYGTSKVTRNTKGEYARSSNYWVRLPDIPQEVEEEK